MLWQNKLNQWRNESDQTKQQLAVTVSIVGTGAIFLIWLVVVAFNLSAPAPAPVKETAPVAVQAVSVSTIDNDEPWWQSLSAGSVEAVLSVWQGMKITTDKIIN